MPTIPSKGSQIAVNKLRGINLRKSRSQLDEGECDRNFGLFPSQNGLLSRMPGKKPMKVYEDGTTARPVTSCKQAFGIGIIVQNGNSISVESLDALMQRAGTYSLTPASSLTAILGNYANNGVFSTPLGASVNTFYPATIMTISDASSLVSGVTSTSFKLPVGTYRIKATLLMGCTTPTTSNAARAGLYNITNSQFQTQYGGSLEILSTSCILPQMNSGFANARMTIMGRFQVQQPSETFGIYMAQSQLLVAYAGAQGEPSSGVTTQKEIYSLISIQNE